MENRLCIEYIYFLSTCGLLFFLLSIWWFSIAVLYFGTIFRLKTRYILLLFSCFFLNSLCILFGLVYSWLIFNESLSVLPIHLFKMYRFMTPKYLFTETIIYCISFCESLWAIHLTGTNRLKSSIIIILNICGKVKMCERARFRCNDYWLNYRTKMQFTSVIQVGSSVTCQYSVAVLWMCLEYIDVTVSKTRRHRCSIFISISLSRSIPFNWK